MIRVQHVGQYNLDLGSEKGERNGSAEIHLHSPMYHRKKLWGQVCIWRLGILFWRDHLVNSVKMNQKVTSKECVTSVCLSVQVGSGYNASKWELRPYTQTQCGFPARTSAVRLVSLSDDQLGAATMNQEPSVFQALY